MCGLLLWSAKRNFKSLFLVKFLKSRCETLTFFFSSRQRRVFARLFVQGFNNSKDPRLGVEFAGR